MRIEIPKRLLLVSAMLLTGGVATAEEAETESTFDAADVGYSGVLPENIGRARLVNTNMNVTTAYDSDGVESTNLAALDVAVNSLVYEHGITEKLSVGVIIPQASFKFTTASSAVISNYVTNALIAGGVPAAAIGSSSATGGLCPGVDDATLSALGGATWAVCQAALESGAKTQADAAKGASGIADIELGAKYNVMGKDDGNFRYAVGGGLRVATGDAQCGESKCPGKGFNDIELHSFADYKPIDGVNLSNSIKLKQALNDAKLKGAGGAESTVARDMDSTIALGAGVGMGPFVSILAPVGFDLTYEIANAGARSTTAAGSSTAVKGDAGSQTTMGMGMSFSGLGLENKLPLTFTASSWSVQSAVNSAGAINKTEIQLQSFVKF